MNGLSYHGSRSPISRSGLEGVDPDSNIGISTRSFLLGGLLLFAATWVAYQPALNCDFVLYDDPRVVTENANVLGGITWESVAWAFTTNHFSNWMPLTWLSLMLDAELYGSNASGFHATNVLLHIGCAVTLFGIMCQLSSRIGFCLFVAVLFALHPLNTQTVVWIAERKGLVSALFWLMAIFAYLRYCKRPTWQMHILVSVLLSLSFLGKQMALTFPAGMLLLDYWPLGRMFRSTHLRQSFNWRVVREKLPWLLLCLLFVVVGYHAQAGGNALNSNAEHSLLQRLPIVVVAYSTYLRKAVLPADLQFHYHHYGASPLRLLWLPLALAMLAGIGVAYRFRHKFPTALIGLLWYFGTLLPVVGVLQIGEHWIADRYTYIPMIGIWVVFAACFCQTHWIPKIGTALPVILLTGLSVICVVRTRTEVGYWRDSETLFGRALQVDPNNPKALNNLGLIYARRGEEDRAIEMYKKSLGVHPTSATGNNNLGVMCSQRGESKLAIQYFKNAIAYSKTYPDAVINLGLEYAKQGQHDLAIEIFSDYVDRFPTDHLGHGNLASVLKRQGKLQLAEISYRKASELAPQVITWKFHRAEVLSRLARWHEAGRLYQDVIKIDPGSAEAWLGLARCDMSLDRSQRALSDLRYAVSLGIADANTMLQIAFILLTIDPVSAERDAAARSIIDRFDAVPSRGWHSLLHAIFAVRQSDSQAAQTHLRHAASEVQGTDDASFIDVQIARIQKLIDRQRLSGDDASKHSTGE